MLFAVVGEISARAQYGTTVLLATSSHLFTYDFERGEMSRRYAIKEIDKIFTKRMYGNGMMRLRLTDGATEDLFRFTFSVAALCDAVRYYVRALQEGDSVENAVAMMESVYDKMLSICPKCGRTLSAPGVPCIHCMKKGTPPPNVDSAVVKITIDKNKFAGVDLKKVREVVRIAFSSRRKMLVNNLMNGYKMDRQKAEQVLTDAGLPLTIRGENLSAEDFVNLSQVINEKD